MKYGNPENTILLKVLMVQKSTSFPCIVLSATTNEFSGPQRLALGRITIRVSLFRLPPIIDLLTCDSNYGRSEFSFGLK